MINQRKQTSGMLNTSKSPAQGNRETQKDVNDGIFEYCKATPESKEWLAYQVQRVLSFKELKRRNLKLQTLAVEGVMAKANNKNLNKLHVPFRPVPEYSTEKSAIPAILKKVTKRAFHSQLKDTSNVTWKEPVADTKFLPVGWMKVPAAPELDQMHARYCEKFLERSKVSPVMLGIGKSKSETTEKQLSNNFTERSGKNMKPHKRNNGKTKLISNVEIQPENNSTQVNKIGRRSNAGTNKVNGEKHDDVMSAISIKSIQKEKTLRIDATREGNSFKLPSKADLMEAGWVPHFGVKQDHTKSDNSSVFITEGTSLICPNEINHTKLAASGSNIHKSNSNKQTLKKGKTYSADDSIASSIHIQDLNGNFTVHKQKTIATQNTSEKLTVNNDYQTSFCCKIGEENEINQMDEKSEGALRKNGVVKGIHVGDNVDPESDFSTIQLAKKIKTQRLDALESLFHHLKPPVLPEFEVCNVLPGTPEWQKYWQDFNKKIGEYYSHVEKYSKQMDDLLVDDDDWVYKNELKRRHQEEIALKISKSEGMTQMTMPKPPLIRHPLKDTVEIGGYVIRPLGGAVDQANVTTNGYGSFRLEIPCNTVDSDLDGITIDTKFNMMTIAIPATQNGSSFMKLVQIAVPVYKKVQNLGIGHPSHNRGKIIITGK